MAELQIVHKCVENFRGKGVEEDIRVQKQYTKLEIEPQYNNN